jgi:hypothetical protein
MNNSCYVYVYLDPRKPGKFVYDNYRFDYEPFYIGKGTGDRCKTHIWYKDNVKWNRYNFKKMNKIKKILQEGLIPIVVKVFENLNDEEAYLKEEELTNIIGLDNLTNLVHGGSGFKTGMIPWNKGLNKDNNDRMKKISEDRIGDKNPMYGIHQCGIDAPNYGRKFPLNIRKKLMKYKYYVDNVVVDDFKEYCGNNNIDYMKMMYRFLYAKEINKNSFVYNNSLMMRI